MVSESVNDLIDALQRDVAPAGLRLNAAVFDLSRGAWLATCYLPEPEGFGSEGFVLCNPGIQHQLKVGEDGAPSGVDLVAALQGWVSAELGRPWPELYTRAGKFLGLLEPGAADGVVAWRLGARPLVPVGNLADLVLA